MSKTYEMCPSCPQPDECEKVAKHYIDISIPVEVKPNARVGNIEMECCGEPVVICDEEKCTDGCGLILMQKVCIKIPLKYSFKSDVGKTFTECCPPCNGK